MRMCASKLSHAVSGMRHAHTHALTARHRSDYLSVCGAVIGWTRGTALMNSNDIVAPGIEAAGARTFSSGEMAFHIVALLHESVVGAAPKRFQMAW